jgi:hypothetical protein
MNLDVLMIDVHKKLKKDFSDVISKLKPLPNRTGVLGRGRPTRATYLPTLVGVTDWVVWVEGNFPIHTIHACDTRCKKVKRSGSNTQATIKKIRATDREVARHRLWR